MVGSQLENSGWVQGCIIDASELEKIPSLDQKYKASEYKLIVISQSCDIAHDVLEHEPYIEAMVAITITEPKGNYLYNKHPRILHLPVQQSTNDTNVYKEIYLEIKAFERLQIPKEEFLHITYSNSLKTESRVLMSLTGWLSARITRPAHHTEFNNRIKNADLRDKIRDKIKKVGGEISGIYIQLHPDREIKVDENYSVNMILLLPGNSEAPSEDTIKTLELYRSLMTKAKMEFRGEVMNENNVSLALINKFKRFYLDDISYKNNSQLPPEVSSLLS